MNRYKKCLKILIKIGMSVVLLCVAQLLFASTTNDDLGLSSTVDKIRNILAGAGGKLVGFSSLLVGVISSAVKFNPYIFVGCLATCLVCLVGPNIIENIFSAVI